MATYKGDEIPARPEIDPGKGPISSRSDRPDAEGIGEGTWPAAEPDYVPRPGQKHYMDQQHIAQLLGSGDPLSLNGFDPGNILRLIAGASGAPAVDPMTSVLSSVQQKYPALQGQPWALVDSRGKQGAVGQLEFYPPDENENPRPGNATIEVFNPELKGDDLERAVFGDMLHHMPSVDPYYAKMRDALRDSLTPQQLKIDQETYDGEKREFGEDRPFDQWMNESRLDAYVRGKLTPGKANEWRDVYTPDQDKLLAQMLKYLSTPSKQTSAP